MIQFLGDNIGGVIAGLLLAFLYLSAAQVFKNLYQRNVKAAPTGWKIFGWLMFVGAVVFLIGIITDADWMISKHSMTVNVIALFAILVVSLCSLVGWDTKGE